MEQRVFGLDLVRAGAICLVLYAHFVGDLAILKDLPAAPNLGIPGVELFFVLSGYLIGGILLRAGLKNPDGLTFAVAKDFWLRRWFRTLPNYYVYLAAFFLVDPKILKGPLRSLSFVVFGQNFAWPHPDFFQVSWSLAVEEWIYLLLPLLILLFRGLGLRSNASQPAMLRQALAAVVVVLVACSLLRLLVHDDRPFDEGIRKIVVFRLDAIALGVGLAWIEIAKPGFWSWIVQRTWAGCIPGLLAVAYLTFQAARGRLHQTSGVSGLVSKALVFPCIDVTAAFLVARSTTMVAPAAGWFRSAVQRLSLWSYSLYMGHWLVIMLVYRLWPRPENRLSVAESLAGLPLSFGVAWLTYTCVEKPFLRWRDRLVPR